MLITSVWQIYSDPIGNLHTGAVQKCTISAAGANLLSGTDLLLRCFLFSKTPFTGPNYTPVSPKLRAFQHQVGTSTV